MRAPADGAPQGRVYEVFAEALLAHDVDTVFGLMGDANMLYLAHHRDRGGRFVGAVDEGGAAGMADAWSRVTGRVGVASVTHGPAATNTLTSLVEAVRSHSRVLLLTGDTPAEPTYFQRFDLEGLATLAGAGYEKVLRPEHTVRTLSRALQRVVGENRPVVLDLPITLLRKPAGAQAPVRPAVRPSPSVSRQEGLEGALGLIAGARRPVVLAGRGAVESGAGAALVALGERLGAPLATTALGRDHIPGHPADQGICGSLSHSAASGLLAEADCVIAFGASLNLFTALHGELTGGKRIVQVDTDAAAFGSYTPVDEAVVGDARLVAEAMAEALADIDHRPAQGWLDRAVTSLARHDPHADFREVEAVDTIDVRASALRADAVLPVERVVSDIGRFVAGTWPYVRVRDPRDFVPMGAFGSIGLGLAGAIGAAVARPGTPTVLLVGDGGWAMSMAEFATAVRERLPLVVLVLDDGAYGAEHYKLVRWGVDASYSENAWPDPVAVAESMGASGFTVRKLEHFEELAGLVERLDGPLLVDIKLDPHVNVLD
jgi:acetolactate synthase-1/2/3 large subunit